MIRGFITFGYTKTIRSKLNTAIRYLRYYINAITIYQIHSPFLYRFISECITNNKFYYVFDQIGQLHQILLNNQSEIPYVDYGAGSKKTKNPTIASIAKNASSPGWKGIQLHHIAKFMQPNCCLELGSNLGLGTAYLASALKSSIVHTIEGDPSLHQYANQHWKKLGLQNIKSYCGEFSGTLPSVLEQIESPLDLVYLDGNHRKDATIGYTEQLMPYLSSRGVIIVDDIHWSSGMLEAWEALKEMQRFCYSINLGQYGVLFWDDSQKHPHKHITYIDYKYKPWKIGLFAH